MDWGGPLLPEVVPEIGANPVSFFYWRRGVRGRSGLELDWLIASVGGRPMLVSM